MVATMIAIAMTAIGKRMLETRARWSPSERRRRAELGQQKQAELLALLSTPRIASDHWAVGAPSLPDCRRIAG